MRNINLHENLTEASAEPNYTASATVRAVCAAPEVLRAAVAEARVDTRRRIAAHAVPRGTQVGRWGRRRWHLRDWARRSGRRGRRRLGGGRRGGRSLRGWRRRRRSLGRRRRGGLIAAAPELWLAPRDLRAVVDLRVRREIVLL